MSGRFHPLTIRGNNTGALGLCAGDRIIYDIDGRLGRADEFLPDGDALVAFDDGAFETVKWTHLRKASEQ